MIVWVVFNISLLLCCLLAVQLKYKTILLYVWLLISVFAGVRYNVGTDFSSYVSFFHLAEDGGNYKGLLFDCLSYFFSVMNLNEQSIFMCYSLLTNCFFYYGFTTISKSIDANKQVLFLSLSTLFYVLLIFPQTLNQIRQFLSISIVFVMLIFLVNRRLILSLSLLIFAFLAHPSSIFMLLLFPLYYKNMSIGIKFMVIVLSIAAVDPLGLAKDIYVAQRLPYYGYFIYEEFNKSADTFGMLSAFVFSVFACFVCVYVSSKNHGKKYINIVVLSVLAYSFVKMVSIDFIQVSRLANYFKPFLVVIYSLLFTTLISEINNQFAKSTIIVFGAIFVASSSLFLSYVRSVTDDSYSFYNVNLCFVGEPCQI